MIFEYLFRYIYYFYSGFGFDGAFCTAELKGNPVNLYEIKIIPELFPQL
jgi:hypothetical protein